MTRWEGGRCPQCGRPVAQKIGEPARPCPDCTAAEEPARHEWGGEGDRCVKCGDKDWMADPVCSESKLRRQAEGDE